jgi:sensor histidine kinase YesM
MDISFPPLYRRLSQAKVHHFLFWLIYWLFWVFVYLFTSTTKGSLINAFINSFIIIVVHAIASYFNIYILFPRMLKKKLYLYYIVSIVLTVILCCFLLAYTYTILENNKLDIWSTTFFTFNAFLISYTVAITMSLKMVKQWYEREQLTRKLHNLNVETELKYLKSQINPHFLFNCLNSLYALSLKKSELAPKMVLRLSDLLRYLLYEAGERFVDLDKELEYLKNYLELEKIRHGDRLHPQLEVKGNFVSKKIAPMLFLTFLENSFKHGLSNESSAGFIHIEIDVQDNELTFSIGNSKPRSSSISEQLLKGPGGIGLENVKKRLELLYPGKHELNISETKDEYLVNLKLTLNEDFKIEEYEMYSN